MRNPPSCRTGVSPTPAEDRGRLNSLSHILQPCHVLMMHSWPVGMIWSVEDRLTVTVLASISVNMNSPPSKSPFRYNSALGEGMRGSEPTQTESGKRRQLASPRRTCSLCRCRLEAPSSTRWPRGPADSCRRGWGDSGHSCGPAGLLMDKQCVKIKKRWRTATEAGWKIHQASVWDERFPQTWSIWTQSRSGMFPSPC